MTRSSIISLVNILLICFVCPTRKRHAVNEDSQSETKIIPEAVARLTLFVVLAGERRASCPPTLDPE